MSQSLRTALVAALALTTLACQDTEVAPTSSALGAEPEVQEPEPSAPTTTDLVEPGCEVAPCEPAETAEPWPVPDAVAVTGSMIDALYQVPIPGVEVCLLVSPLHCAVSDREGNFELQVHGRGEILLKATAGGYAPSLLHMEIGDQGGDFADAPMVRDGHLDYLSALAGATADPSRGHILGALRAADGQGIEDGVVAMEPAPVPVVHFDRAQGLEIPDGARVYAGTYGAINLEPGSFELSLGRAAGECSRPEGRSWAGSDAEASERTMVRVLPGTVSVFAPATCD